jgi:hypothetical protein
MHNRRQVLFILATNYVGSHYLSLQVGSHSKAEHVGEIVRLDESRVRKEPCYICGTFTKCPLYQGIEPGKVEHIHEQIFSNLGDETQLLVDNSKKIYWAERFLRNVAFEKKFVHLIRDSRALVRRFDLDFNTLGKRWHQRRKVLRTQPALAPSLLFATRRQIYLHKWLQQNQAITTFLRQHGLDYYLMTYRDLATNTASELEKLMSWLGLNYEPSQIEYWNFEHHGSQKPEYDWIKEKRVSRYFDTRWRDYLSPAEQDYCVNHPRVRAYLDSIGVRVIDEGLTKR